MNKFISVKTIDQNVDLEKLTNTFYHRVFEHQTDRADIAVAVGDDHVPLEFFYKFGECFGKDMEVMWEKSLQKALDNELWGGLIIALFKKRKMRGSFFNASAYSVSFHTPNAEVFDFSNTVHVKEDCTFESVVSERKECDPELKENVLSIITKRCCKICKKKTVVEKDTFQCYDENFYFYKCENEKFFGLFHKSCYERLLLKHSNLGDESCPYCNKPDNYRKHRLDLTPLLKIEDDEF